MEPFLVSLIVYVAPRFIGALVYALATALSARKSASILRCVWGGEKGISHCMFTSAIRRLAFRACIARFLIDSLRYEIFVRAEERKKKKRPIDVMFRR